jgi:hypothetical protein
MKRFEKILRGASCRRMAFLCTVGVFLISFAGVSIAAPNRTPVKKTGFNPLTLKPVWVSDASKRSDSALADLTMYQAISLSASTANLSMSSVVVPTRPSVRSPFMPPATLPANFPWSVGMLQ